MGRLSLLMHIKKSALLHRLLWTFGLCSIYLVLAIVLVGFKTDQLILVSLFTTCYLSADVTRKWIIGFSIFLVYWIIFDFMKAFPNYLYNEVHIGSLYLAEKALFGIQHLQETVTPNEYWLHHQHILIDVLSGLFYLCWVPVPLSLATYFFFKNRKQFLHFSLSFFIINMIGFAVYYLYPAAPPWYVQAHGFDFIPRMAGNEAGLQKFDHYFGTSVFRSLYGKSSNVFAAMPSLHSAYPLFVLYYGLKYRLGRINIFFVIITFGIWFAAVYTSHHYVLDVLAGVATTIAGISLFNLLLKYSKGFQYFLRKYESIIS